MKYWLLSLIIVIGINGLNAQGKVKGDRNVTTQITNIDAFHTIALDEDFEVSVVFNQNPAIEIETDQNLHEYIAFQVVDSVLSFNKKAKITSEKELNIKIVYNKALKHIRTTADSEISSLTSMDLKDGTMICKGDSKANLTIKSDNFSFEGDDKSKVKLNLTGKTTSIILNGNGKLEALLNTTKLTASLLQRADAEIEGSCDEAKLDLDNNSKFDGKNFTINTCTVTCNISSDAILEVLNTVAIEASGSSSVYLYEEPKITVNKLIDTAKIQKKEK